MIKDRIIKILLCVAVVLLTTTSVYFWRQSISNTKSVVSEGQYQKNETQYVVISNDKTLKELKKTNEELYDSIKKLSDVKEAVQIKYVTKYKTDTVYFDKTYIPKDSIYHYAQESDTVNYDLKIKAKDVDWFTLDMSIQDSLMLVTRNKNGQSETTITHGMNTSIIDATVFVPKKTTWNKIKERTYFGVGVGAGYGIINKKTDVFVGVTVGIKL